MPSEPPPAVREATAVREAGSDQAGPSRPSAEDGTLRRRLLPFSGIVVLVVVWQAAVGLTRGSIIPGPIGMIEGLVELTKSGLLFRYVVASLFRVTWGYLAAVCVGIPLGLCIGWFRRAELAVNPLMQMLRPISPLAWIPIAILFFGVGDQSAIFIIFLGAFFPLTVAAINSVSNVSATHLNAGRNFGLSTFQMLRHIVFPSALPQLIVGMRLALGVAWLVVVAAEMIAVTSGLGFLIVEARNAGSRYDLVLAGMAVIGTIGLLLDVVMRRLERMKGLLWSYAANAPTETIRHVERRRHAR